jgi:hypothetical protein
MLKRGIQLLILAILVSVNWQLAARTDACEQNGPQWCCENIVCPNHYSYCYLAGGTTSCFWDEGSGTCEMTPCMN